MSQDRIDLAFAAKALAMRMARPCKGDEIPLKRCIKYLKSRPRGAYVYGWQEKPSQLDIYTDSDWAAEKVTRRSTSGGVIMQGRHLIHHWSRTQGIVALSSGEAELNASVKGVSEGLQLKYVAEALGRKLRIELFGDSTAAKGILMRSGSGSVKHLSTKQLWVQGKVEKGEVKVTKIKRTVNVADSCTHAWGKGEADRHFRVAGVKWYDARRSKEDNQQKRGKEETVRSGEERGGKKEKRRSGEKEDKENGDDITETEKKEMKTEKKEF